MIHSSIVWFSCYDDQFLVYNEYILPSWKSPLHGTHLHRRLFRLYFHFSIHYNWLSSSAVPDVTYNRWYRLVKQVLFKTQAIFWIVVHSTTYSASASASLFLLLKINFEHLSQYTWCCPTGKFKSYVFVNCTYMTLQYINLYNYQLLIIKIENSSKKIGYWKINLHPA